MKSEPLAVEVRAKMSLIIDSAPPGPPERITGWTATACERVTPAMLKLAHEPILDQAIERVLEDAVAYFQEAHSTEAIQAACARVRREIAQDGKVSLDRWGDYTTVMRQVRQVAPAAKHLVYLGTGDELMAELSALGYRSDSYFGIYIQLGYKTTWAVLGRGMAPLTIAWQDLDASLLGIRLPGDPPNFAAVFCRRCGTKFEISPTTEGQPRYQLPAHRAPCDLPCRSEEWKESQPVHKGDFDCPECWPTETEKTDDAETDDAEQGASAVPPEEPQEGDHA
jgi:hypothetical protein